MTTKGISKVVAVAITATAFDARTELGASATHPANWQNLRIQNLDGTNMVTVNWGNPTALAATLRGDDMKTILPRQSALIPWSSGLSLIADTAVCNVEISGE